MPRTILVVGALIALPSTLALAAEAKHHHRAKPAGGGQSQKVDSVAYPKAPGGMPASADKGMPVTPKPDPAAKPGPSSAASSEGAAAKVGTPSTAYPGAPGGEPAAADKGKPIKP